LKNGVAEGVASNPHDDTSSLYLVLDKSILTDWGFLTVNFNSDSIPIPKFDYVS
jgi:hypothetical protein